MSPKSFLRKTLQHSLFLHFLQNLKTMLCQNSKKQKKKKKIYNENSKLILILAKNIDRIFHFTTTTVTITHHGSNHHIINNFTSWHLMLNQNDFKNIYLCDRYLVIFTCLINMTPLSSPCRYTNSFFYLKLLPDGAFQCKKIQEETIQWEIEVTMQEIFHNKCKENAASFLSDVSVSKSLLVVHKE